MNKFCDKLIQLRREKGYSQEQLAEYLEVSRQSVSKWEADKTMPEISKLIAISQLFHVSLDYLLIDSCENRGDKKWEPASETEEIRRTINEVKDYIGYQKGFEYKSRVTVAGIPLIHIKFGRYTGRIRMKDAAKGIIAVGNIAIGVVSAGFFSIGIFSIGMLSLGLLVSLGIVSIGLLAMGVAAIGIVAGGVTSLGIYATGVAAVGKNIATGVSAVGRTAVARQGEELWGYNMTAVDDGVTREWVKSYLISYNPKVPKWILDFLTLMYK